jgi:kinesin family member 1
MLFPGDSHVFRFNNPEEVRKQRDRAKSSMHITVTANDGDPTVTRPGSPGGSASSEPDLDWTFAQREAALARLHGLDPGLDSLPDEDLNKLFDRITKLKSSRETRDLSVKGRPESSLSGVEDMWSEAGRPFSNEAYTDDTSVDPGPNGTPELDGMSEIHGHLDAQKLDYEARLNAIQESSEANDLKVEKEHMQTQLKMVQMQMKRLLELRARGIATDNADLVPFEATIYTARELRLLRKTLDRWRAHRSFSMSEIILANAVTVKEANAIRHVLSMAIRSN